MRCFLGARGLTEAVVSVEAEVPIQAIFKIQVVNIAIRQIRRNHEAKN